MTRYGKKKSTRNPSTRSAPARPVERGTIGPLAGPPPDVLMLTGDQLAALLQVSRKTVDRLARDGSVPGRIKLGNRVLYHRPTVEAWLTDLVAAGLRQQLRDAFKP